ncbi:helix-turn-helix domain-containing protein [Robertkochia marina]|uniref:Helix-turn-helix domain-containing protein n=1 Tax=Robertkochia marina TaxID=1227945 RepID=A0A4V3UY82_9FLAO|nr:helix-turn-helix domain-containing protein [Robertkochia marina]THD67856.1 helix-turn-helix domain-containing protein [Robertkochia marina]TRZ42105.1 helix-turn-helix domain-containing protein [Robertkochia marina]
MLKRNLSSDDQKLLSELTSLVIENLEDRTFGTKELVRNSGMSRSQLYRKIQKLTGKSTTRFIRDIRLEESLNYLKSEDFTIAEIASKVGFSSPSYFSKAFKDLYSRTPGDFREQGQIKDLKPVGHKEGPRKLELFSNLIALAVLVFILGLLIRSADSNFSSVSRAATISPKNSIAVLPLENKSGNTEVDYMTYGISDALISHLSQSEVFGRVVPMIRVMELNASRASAHDLAGQLGVDHLITGSLETFGNNFQINLQCLQAADNRVIWQQSYQINPGSEDIFKFQDRVAESVMKALDLGEGSNEQRPGKYDHGTNDPEAYRAYLKAQYTAANSSTENMKKALPLYRKALSIDPQYTDAYVGLASLWLFGSAVWGMSNPEQGWQKAEALLLTAQDIDPTDPNITYALMTGAFYYEWNFDYVEAIYDPEDEFSMLAIDFDYLIKTGRYQLARKNVLKALEDNPDNGGAYPLLAMHALVTNQPKEALAILDEQYLKYPKDLFFLRESTKCYLLLGEDQKAKKIREVIQSRFNEEAPIYFWFEAVLAHRSKDENSAKKNLEILEAKYAESPAGSPAWFMAMYYFLKEDLEKGFTWLRRSYESREVEMTWLKVEPILKPYRDHPVYLELLEAMNFPEGDFKRRKSTTIIP